MENTVNYRKVIECCKNCKYCDGDYDDNLECLKAKYEEYRYGGVSGSSVCDEFELE